MCTTQYYCSSLAPSRPPGPDAHTCLLVLSFGISPLCPGAIFHFMIPGVSSSKSSLFFFYFDVFPCLKLILLCSSRLSSEWPKGEHLVFSIPFVHPLLSPKEPLFSSLHSHCFLCAETCQAYLAMHGWEPYGVKCLVDCFFHAWGHSNPFPTIWWMIMLCCTVLCKGWKGRLVLSLPRTGSLVWGFVESTPEVLLKCVFFFLFFFTRL